MRRFLALAFLVVGLSSGKAWGQWEPFDQCISQIQSAFQNCDTYYSDRPNYRVIPTYAETSWDNTGRTFQILDGGCKFYDSGIGGEYYLHHTCYTHIPGEPTVPIKGFFFAAGSCEQGSKIRTEEMSVTEEVPIGGTGFRLIYTSERTLGRVKAYQTNFGMSSFKKTESKDSYMPTMLYYTFTYADGRQGFLNLPYGATSSFTWDGKDSVGNYLESPAPVSVLMKIDSPYYSISSDFSLAESVGTWNVKQMGLGGWNIDIHHLLDYVGKRLYLGDGSTIPVKPIADGSNYQVVSEDGSEIYNFNSAGKHISTNNALTNSVKYYFYYSVNGFLTSIVDSYGNTTSILRDGSGNLTGIQSPFGRITQLSIGTDGYLASITSPKNETYQMTYYSSGLLYTFQKPKGQVSTMSYDSYGNLVGDSNSAGNFINLTLSGNALTIQDALGNKKTSNLTGGVTTSSHVDYLRSGEVTSSAYDSNNSSTYSQIGVSTSIVSFGDNPRFVGFSKIPNQTMSILVDPSLTSTTDIIRTVNNTSNPQTPFNYNTIATQSTTNGKTSNAIYTRATGVTSFTSPLSRSSSITTDTFGKITNATFASFQPVQFSYDTHGRLQYVTQNTRQTEIQYNASGDISGVKNALNQTTGFTYDLAGHVESVILPDLRTINYTYDANGNVASITPSGTNAHAFTFNPFDLPEYYTPPTVPTSTPATHYTYDNAKRITQITKPDSSTVTFNYHPTTQLLTSIVSSGDTTSMTIEPYSGQPSSMTSQDGIATTQTFASDLFVSSASSNASSVNIGGVTYTYNNDFLPTNLNITAASGSSSVNYTYDNDNIMKTAGSLGYSLDASTGLKTKAVLSKIQEVYSYDSTYGEPSSMFASYVPTSGTSTPIFSQTYTRDALGRIDTKSETIGTTTSQFVYTYDNSGRLTDVTKNSAAYSHYNYSNNNNLTSGNVGGVSFTATYDAQDRILTYNTTTNTSFTHTLNGEMKTKTVGSTTTTYTYNGFGMLKTAKVGTGSLITNLYDGRNRLIGKMSGSTVQKYWVYQDQLRIGAELNSSGTITKKFIYGNKINVPEYMISGSTTYKIISDHLGSVRAVVNASTGAIAQRMEYNELGAVISDSSPGFQPFGFAGGVYDTTTKLVTFGARTYDPSIGRWLSKDPIGFSGGDTNLYGYVLADPVNFVDRNGLDREILRTTGPIPHDYLRIFDPSMPGNDTYVDFGPEGGKTNVVLNLLRDVLGQVNISDERPSDAYYLPGSFQKTSRQADEALLNRANSAALRAIRGELMYSVIESNYNRDSKRTNCRGFAGGL